MQLLSRLENIAIRYLRARLKEAEARETARDARRTLSAASALGSIPIDKRPTIPPPPKTVHDWVDQFAHQREAGDIDWVFYRDSLSEYPSGVSQEQVNEWSSFESWAADHPDLASELRRKIVDRFNNEGERNYLLLANSLAVPAKETVVTFSGYTLQGWDEMKVSPAFVQETVEKYLEVQRDSRDFSKR